MINLKPNNNHMPFLKLGCNTLFLIAVLLQKVSIYHEEYSELGPGLISNASKICMYIIGLVI